MGRQRVAAFDIAKGIAIIAVVVGHHAQQLGMPQLLINGIFSFHMPLFFIVSGYFTRPDVTLDRAYVAKNARALLLPYAVTGLLVIALTFLSALLMHPEAVGSDVLRVANGVLYGAGASVGSMPSWAEPIGAIWFLLAMFWGKLCVAAANKVPYTPAFIALLFVLGYVSTPVVWLPWSIQAGLCAALFIYVGQCMRRADLFAPKKIHPLLWCGIAGMWAYCILCGGHLYMVGNTYGDGVVVDVLGGVCATMCVVKAAQFAERKAARAVRWLAVLGAVTLPVFCMHLVEMDVFPWGVACNLLAQLPAPLWLSSLVVRVLVIACLMGVVWLLPRPIAGVFFPSKKAVPVAKGA